MTGPEQLDLTVDEAVALLTEIVISGQDDGGDD